MLGQRRGAVYCGRRCKELAREKRRRGLTRVTDLRAKYPDVARTLAELHDRATPPVPRTDTSDVDDDVYGVDDDPYPDEAGQGTSVRSAAWRLHEAEERIRARYQHLAQPYLTQLTRNPGVRPQGLVELERQRDAEIRALHREHDHQADLDQARRNEPRRITEAHTRQQAQAALAELAQDLPGLSNRYAHSEWMGRATGDIWRW